MALGRLAGKDQFGIGLRPGQKITVGEIVINNHVGFLNALLATQSDQTRIAGTRPDKITNTFLFAHQFLSLFLHQPVCKSGRLCGRTFCFSNKGFLVRLIFVEYPDGHR